MYFGYLDIFCYSAYMYLLLLILDFSVYSLFRIHVCTKDTCPIVINCDGGIIITCSIWVVFVVGSCSWSCKPRPPSFCVCVLVGPV